MTYQRFADLDKLQLAKLAYDDSKPFMLEPSFTNTPAVLKNYNYFKSGQKWLKNIYLTF